MTGFEWLGGAALLGVVAAMWRHLRGIGTRCGRAAIQKVELDRWLGQLVYLYCRDQRPITGWAARSFSSAYVYLRPLRRHEIIASEDASNEPIVFWFGRTPLLLVRQTARQAVGQSSPGDVPVERVDDKMFLYFIRGTVDIDAVLLASLQRYYDCCVGRTHTNGTVTSGRFVVYWLSGDSRSDMNNARESGNGPRAVGCLTNDHRPVFGIDTYWEERGIRYLGWHNHQVGPQPAPVGGSINTLALTADLLQHIEEVRRWNGSREWFLDRRIPWQFGWLIVGPPGSGKSVLCRSLAQDLDMPIYVFDLSSMSNSDFAASWASAVSNVPCMVLLEDFDVTFCGRENVVASKQGKHGGSYLSFDFLLNKISGVDNSDGVLLCITSNHPETIDPAIAVVDRDVTSRPGRVDRIIRLGPLDEPCRRKLATIILTDWPDAITEMVASGDGDTGAQFQGRCVQYALARSGWRMVDPEPPLEQSVDDVTEFVLNHTNGEPHVDE